MISSTQPPSVEPFISAFINDITSSKMSIPLVLILEDYHFIDSPVVHDGLSFLLDHMPPQMRLVISSRADPPLQLSRFRARNQIMEIRARDLRFTAEEAAAFLADTMDLEVSAEMISIFDQRTEGWIAGLQLAAMSLQQQEYPNDFMIAFAGDDRYVADYLMEEVFRQQPDSVQSFLLGTSVLDSQSAPLCDAVLEIENSRAILNELEASNLFIVALDNQRRWYRYHHLFADLLRHRLEEQAPIREVENMHARASRWYEKNGFLIAAVNHSLAARDYQSAIRLIEEGDEELFQGSQLNILLEWWSELPKELVESQPKLCLLYSWAWLATGHPEQASSCLPAIEKELGATMNELFVEGNRAESIKPAVLVALSEIAVVRGQIAIMRGDIEKALMLSELVLPYVLEEDQPYIFNPPASLRMVAYFNMGIAHKIRGELGKADSALVEAVKLAREKENVHIVAAGLGHLAHLQSIKGDLGKAEQTCIKGLQIIQDMAGRRSPMSGRLHAELGTLLFERNDMRAAQQHLRSGISVAMPWGYIDALQPGYKGLAWMKAAQGDWTGAFDALDDLAQLNQGNQEFFSAVVDSFRAGLWAAQGNVDSAVRWVETSGLHVEGELSYFREEETIILVRVLLAQNRWDDALSLIERLLVVTESGERWGRVIELLILRALALDAWDLLDEAMESLARALILAEPHGYVRVFIDEGESIARLLYKAAAQGITSGYTGELLDAFQNLESVRDTDTETRQSKSGIVEPLSPRELEVLNCLSEGLSNREIALRLTISLTTVKTHTRNIYRKLGVNSRTQAVAKGRVLGIT
jgi:LuxR family maltose regulon positive regulatory protein